MLCVHSIPIFLHRPVLVIVRNKVPISVDQVSISREQIHGNVYNYIKYCLPVHGVILIPGSETQRFGSQAVSWPPA